MLNVNYYLWTKRRRALLLELQKTQSQPLRKLSGVKKYQKGGRGEGDVCLRFAVCPKKKGIDLD